jgi:hypothetical protein
MITKFPANLTRTELANMRATARRNKQPEVIIEAMWRDGLEFIAQRKSDNARKKQLANMWHVHIEPLRLERKRVVASLAYRGHNRNNGDPRQMALKAYKKVLDELLRRMKREACGVPHVDRPTMTPVEYAKVKNAPNNGEHWTDFVPSHIKQKVLALFEVVPHTPKARRKIPFERVIDSEMHNIRKERLIKRTEKELMRSKQDVLLHPHNDAVLERVQRIEDALVKISQLDPNEPVPTTWHGLSRL